MKITQPRHRSHARRRPIHPIVKADVASPAASAITARYAYDGFGKEVAVSGADADKNAFRFSTKQLDVEVGISYYGYRFYSADAGRWINRDLIAEKGGLNIYEMVRNNALNIVDFLGNAGCSCRETKPKYIEVCCTITWRVTSTFKKGTNDYGRGVVYYESITRQVIGVTPGARYNCCGGKFGTPENPGTIGVSSVETWTVFTPKDWEKPRISNQIEELTYDCRY